MENIKTIWPAGYFLPRDFEIVQPIYDLAFLLQVVPRARSAEVSKYRTLSLGKVAHSLDSYSTGVAHWFRGELPDSEVDYVPSSRIKNYLATIIEKGTLDELGDFLSEKARGCLHLRSHKGLGPKIIAEFYAEYPSFSRELLVKASRRSGLTEEQILEAFYGKAYGPWQTAHVIAPLVRLLQYVEHECKQSLNWQISGLKGRIAPVREPFLVFLTPNGLRIDRSAITRAIQKTPFFSAERQRDGIWTIHHAMGWHFSLAFGEEHESSMSLFELASRYDPLLSDLPEGIISDLHMHTSWSDGLATQTLVVLDLSVCVEWRECLGLLPDRIQSQLVHLGNLQWLFSA